MGRHMSGRRRMSFTRTSLPRPLAAQEMSRPAAEHRSSGERSHVSGARETRCCEIAAEPTEAEYRAALAEATQAGAYSRILLPWHLRCCGNEVLESCEYLALQGCALWHHVRCNMHCLPSQSANFLCTRLCKMFSVQQPVALRRWRQQPPLWLTRQRSCAMRWPSLLLKGSRGCFWCLYAQ